MSGLPREIPDEIWKYTLYNPAWNTPSSETCQQPQQPAICRVNQQMRHECLPMFYNCNTFHLHVGDPSSVAWLRAIGPSNIQNLRHLILTNIVMRIAPCHCGKIEINGFFDLQDGSLTISAYKAADTKQPHRERVRKGVRLAAEEFFRREIETAFIRGVERSAEGLTILMERFDVVCKDWNNPLKRYDSGLDDNDS
ncbi:uncharacterized protein LTR77_003296 [Saxophila tyrrhenica]|uniref:Uncharacterized protein n=1 Tax=Saxophila tyrrhenica TaxID=1690608 RepID=A0AAV9PGZ6_9PEZI|nr:hypothetical protein LTR77_003296 [Saxophila tyrrhenica]